jgi:bifunctional ADP-heptose synthase (sugar kinase/adenylyltransferase)
MQQLKGLRSSFIPQDERAEILANLEAVDAVVIFDEPTPLNLMNPRR